MRLSASAVGTFLVLAATSTFQSAQAFTAVRGPLSTTATTSASSSAFLPTFSAVRPQASSSSSSTSSLSMSFSVGIVGATGAVGKEIRQCLEKREFPVSQLRIFGSERSAGKTMPTEKYGDIEVELFDVAKARECDVVFLAVSGDFALEHAEAICKGDDGAVVIDNSSAFRYKPEIPLVVPEINGKETKKSKLIANPNCTTAIGLMAIWPLIQKFGCKRVIMSTYQAASGAGQPGMDELQDGTRVYLEGGTPENSIFAYPLPFNVIPQIDKFQENGYTKEEMKVTWETRKICGLADDFPVSCSAVRIPTIRAHSEVIIMETEKPVDIKEAQKVLDEAPGVKLVDNPDELAYPMPITATGQYDVEVGRLRKSLVFGDYGIEFFVSGDQLLRGAALNAVLVGEEMVSNGSIKEKATA
ncbi:Aspartate-semialdehyde dehydrogenase [Seminavis robusta]|uniref:aspartate-semialdehyde dehydrogenase n=1 Tax=Seminavis robusta TaxID=568900 RepID=A0A9N8ENP1_9STRA|nr:Aspartate-semialdehyde dehydrogenase [Seminavis robusta]|eukprot:Sro1242_g255530.1 Aspartate-semialdehyde dehydrogenase (415) ;mRNA; r:27906-29335